MKILVIEGTVREGRKSIHAARKAAEVFRERGHDVDLFDMEERDVPLMKERRFKVETSEVPEDVEEYGRMVEEADGILIVSPEYNHGIPGSLKNLIDYLYPEYEDKPFSYITVSGGGFGGVRAQTHLNEITLALDANPGPSLPVSNVNEVFDEEGNLIDDSYRERFENFAEKTEEHVQKFV